MGGQHKRVQRLSVVPYTSKRLHRIMVVVVICGYFLAAAAGYWWGYERFRHDLGRKLESIQRLEAKNQSLADSAHDLQSQLIQHQQSLALEQQTIELIRQENLSLQSKVSELEQEVAFFDQVVKTTKDAQGLAFGRVGIASKEGNQFEVSVDIMQISGRKRLKGKLYIELEGFDAQGEKQKIALAPLNNNQADSAADINFVSYQTVLVPILLPDNFEPKALILTAKIERGKQVELTKSFQWVVQ